MRRVCIFAASSATLDPIYTDAAFELGVLLAQHEIELVFGGGRTGLMGACARGVKSRGGRVTGIIPQKLNVPGIAFEECDELIVTADMHERKAIMERISDAFITLPGGMGTLEELMEVLTLNQLGYLSTPVVLLNVEGFYDELAAQLRTFVSRGFMDEACLSLFTSAATPAEAVKKLLSFRLPRLPDKIRDAIENDEKGKKRH
jgi:uncharacterized protein (TIGR00730 family)